MDSPNHVFFKLSMELEKELISRIAIDFRCASFCSIIFQCILMISQNTFLTQKPARGNRENHTKDCL